MRSLIKLQLFRFVLVGTLNSAFSYSVYALLIYAGFNYFAANFCTAILGILFSFRTQGRLVFNNPEGSLFFRFAACWAGIFLAHTFVISCLIRFGFNAYAAGAIALIPVALASYLVQKRLVFNSSAAPSRIEPVEG